MPSQKDMQTSAPSLPAPSANHPTPTPAVTPAATNTTSPAKPSAPPASKFRDECIVLILAPQGTVHPMVHKDNKPPGARVFANADDATAQVMSSKVGMANPFAIVPLKDLF